MALDLETFAAGDTDYIAKHNANVAAIAAAVVALQAQVAASAGLAVPTAVRSLFGEGVVRLGAGAYVATEDGTDLEVTAGYAWLPDVLGGVVVRSTVAQTVPFAGVPSGTYYLVADSTGVVSRSDDDTAALYEVEWDGSDFTAVTDLAGVGWCAEELAAALVSGQLGETFERLVDRLDAAETATQALLAITVTGADVTPAAAAIRQAQYLRLTGTLTGNRSVIVPDVEKFWTVQNACSGAYTVTTKTAAGAGVTTTPGESVPVYCDGDNVLDVRAGASYDVGFYFPGVPGNSETLLIFVAVRAFTLPAGLTGSRIKALDAATSEAVCSVRKNGVEVGTATFGAAGDTATLALSGGASFAAGDLLSILAPSTADATLGRIYGTIAARR